MKQPYYVELECTQHDLLDCIRCIWFAHTGSGDGILPGDRAVLLSFLRRRLEQWEPSGSAVENALRALVEAVCKECK